jgi:hypothetical protein
LLPVSYGTKKGKTALQKFKINRFFEPVIPAGLAGEAVKAEQCAPVSNLAAFLVINSVEDAGVLGGGLLPNPTLAVLAGDLVEDAPLGEGIEKEVLKFTVRIWSGGIFDLRARYPVGACLAATKVLSDLPHEMSNRIT